MAPGDKLDNENELAERFGVSRATVRDSVRALIDAQRVDEACWIWDGTGRLVAHGTQLAGIRLG